MRNPRQEIIELNKYIYSIAPKRRLIPKIKWFVFTRKKLNFVLDYGNYMKRIKIY